MLKQISTGAFDTVAAPKASRKSSGFQLQHALRVGQKRTYTHRIRPYIQ